MAHEVFAVFGRLWIILLAFFQSVKATSSTILPLASKSPAGPRLRGPQDGRVGSLMENADTNGLGKWQEQKQEFLRHPSLRRSKEGKQYKFDKGKRKERTSRPVTPTLKIQDWSYIPATDLRPPPRPPRPPSGPVPSVIVTPSTPTIVVLPELSSSTAQISLLDYTETGHASENISSPEETAPQPAQEDNNINNPVAAELYTGPPLPGRDIAELKVDDLENPFRAPDSIVPVETPRRSFNIPQSLKTISFGPLRYTTDALFAVSDMLCDEPPWIYQTSPTDRLVARANSYITSTPAKNRLENTMDREGKQGSESLFSDANSPRSLHLPDDQMDLLPYPDVFDLDMYYGLESNRLSIPRHNQATPSRNRQPPTKRANRFSPSVHNQISKNTDSPKSEKRFGFIPDAQSPQNSSPTKFPEVKRYRDHYRHPAFTRPPHVSPNTSVDSLGEAKTPQASRVLTSIYPGNLNRVSPQTPTAPRSGKTAILMSNTHHSPIKDRGIYPPPPIVVVSHHRFGSFSEASQSTDFEDSQELRARLREACDNFSKSIWTDESCSLEAVSLN